MPPTRIRSPLVPQSQRLQLTHGASARGDTNAATVQLSEMAGDDGPGGSTPSSQLAGEPSLSDLGAKAARLREVFPDFDHATIVDVLASRHGNFDGATDDLVKMSSRNSPRCGSMSSIRGQQQGRKEHGGRLRQARPAAGAPGGACVCRGDAPVFCCSGYRHPSHTLCWRKLYPSGRGVQQIHSFTAHARQLRPTARQSKLAKPGWKTELAVRCPRPGWRTDGASPQPVRWNAC